VTARERAEALVDRIVGERYGQLRWDAAITIAEAIEAAEAAAYERAAKECDALVAANEKRLNAISCLAARVGSDIATRIRALAKEGRRGVSADKRKQDRCTFNVGLAPGQRCGRCGYVELTPRERATLADLGAEEVAPGVYVAESGSLDEPEGEW
jgi:ribosomal protein S27AE